MKVLSLFDGISCARVALKKAGYKYVEYYASEIDSKAIEIAMRNFPDTIQLGGVQEVGKKDKRLRNIDLLIGGSPCQDLSIAGKRAGLSGERSGLFWEYVRILKEVKPKYFILENVASMPKEAKEVITEALGVEPIMINASLVSAQQRKRLFWTNIPNVTQPKDRGIMLKDIIHETRGEKFDLERYVIKGNHLEWITNDMRLKKKYTALNGDKALTMMARQYASWNGQYLLVVPEATKKGFALAEFGDSVDLSFPNSTTRRGRVGKKAKTLMTSSTIGVVGKGYVRKLTPTECARLQSLPRNYVKGASDSQAYKALGNAFNADVIAHQLKNIKHGINNK